MRLADQENMLVPFPQRILTVPYQEDFSTNECDIDIGELAFHFEVQNYIQKNMAGPNPLPLSSSSSS